MSIFYEPVCWGLEHAPFNAALLAASALAWPNERHTFYAESGHLSAVRSLLTPGLQASIDWNVLDIAPRSARGFGERLWSEKRAVAAVFQHACLVRARDVISCGTTESGLFALKCLIRLTSWPTRVTVIHHGRLASMMESSLTRALLARGNGSSVQHIVLGESIRQNVVRRLPSMSRSLFAMRHPYFLPDPGPVEWHAGSRIRFGFLGLASSPKGFDRFCRLARHVSETSAANGMSRFELVGTLAREYQATSDKHIAAPFDDVPIDIPSHGAKLPRTEYEHRLSALTYAVFPYDRNAYQYVSSGAILDAFAYAKPCIVLRNALFETYFREMGNIGHLCDDEDDMMRVVAHLATRPLTHEYLAQRDRILERRHIFSATSVAHELRALLG